MLGVFGSFRFEFSDKVVNFSRRDGVGPVKPEPHQLGRLVAVEDAGRLLPVRDGDRGVRLVRLKLPKLPDGRLVTDWSRKIQHTAVLGTTRSTFLKTSSQLSGIR
jgi:hypothetical protein